MYQIGTTGVYVGGGHKGQLCLLYYEGIVLKNDSRKYYECWIVSSYNCDSLHTVFSGLKELNEQGDGFTKDIDSFLNKNYDTIYSTLKYIWDNNAHYGKCLRPPDKFCGRKYFCSFHETIWEIDFREIELNSFKNQIRFASQQPQSLHKKQDANDVDLRKTSEYKKWRKSILKRDKKCVVCGYDKSLDVHHLYGFKEYPMHSVDIGNGVTLCRHCHRKYHEIYGNAHINPADFVEFLNRYKVNFLR